MIFYNYATNNKNKKGYTYHDHFHYINKYFGITQNPTTQNFMIITKYYESGDLRNHITNDFYNISWFRKLIKLQYILNGLKNMHEANIIHRDYHSGNILVATGETPITSDLGISKSATEPLNDDDEEIYGIIPYVAPEIFQGRKYTKASDIYSFGMIMWELMTGRRPFWDRVHDSELIIEICYGLRPPIITNAPEGYIELMNECWHFDPVKRPTANNLLSKVKTMLENEINRKNPTKIIESPDIGPVTTNNPGAIYKSRPLSGMIKSAASTINLKSLNITLEIGNISFFFMIIGINYMVYYSITNKVFFFKTKVFLK
jgi:serine/threonine protein kinase